MKRKNIILFAIASLLTLGAFSLAIRPDITSEVKADESLTKNTGFWKRVTSTDELTDGTTVAIVSDQNYVLDGIGLKTDAQCSTTGDNTNVSGINATGALDNDYLYFSNKPYIPFKIFNSFGDWYFVGDVVFDSETYSSYILAFVGSSDLEEPFKDTINRFKDDIGFAKTLSDRATWDISFDSNHIAYIKNTSTQTNLYYANPDSYGHNGRFQTNGDNSNLSLYVQVDVGNSLTTVRNPYYTIYNSGETISLDGLITSLSVTDGDPIVMDYSRNLGLLNLDTTSATSAGDITYRFGTTTYAGTFAITLTGDEKAFQYTGQSGLPSEVCGTYLLASTSPLVSTRGFIFNAVTGASCQHSDIPSRADIYTFSDIGNCTISVVRSVINGNAYLHAKTNDGNYLAISSEAYTENYIGGGTKSGFYPTTVSSVSSDNAISFYNTYSSRDGLYYSYIKIGAYYLRFDVKGYKFYFCNEMESPLLFYKGTTINSERKEAEQFIVNFLSLTSACDGGVTDFEQEENWATLKSSYQSMSVDAQVIISSATYTSRDENVGLYNAENVVARYDFIISKYGTDKYEDFLCRIATGLLVINSAELPLSQMSDTLPIVILSVSISVVSVIAILVFKKRKQIN